MSSKKHPLLVQSIDTSGQITEAILKTFITPYSGPITEIVSGRPIVSSFVGIYNGYNIVKEQSFNKKFWAFYNMFSEEEYNSFKKIIYTKKEQELGECIFSALDNVSKTVQAKMIAKSVKLYVSSCEQGNDEEAQLTFDYHIYVIKNLDNYLISGMKLIYGNGDVDQLTSFGKALFNLDLVDQEQKTNYISDTVPLITFTTSDKGKSFYRNIILGCIDN